MDVLLLDDLVYPTHVTALFRDALILRDLHLVLQKYPELAKRKQHLLRVKQGAFVVGVLFQGIYDLKSRSVRSLARTLGFADGTAVVSEGSKHFRVSLPIAFVATFKQALSAYYLLSGRINEDNHPDVQLALETLKQALESVLAKVSTNNPDQKLPINLDTLTDTHQMYLHTGMSFAYKDSLEEAIVDAMEMKKAIDQLTSSYKENLGRFADVLFA